MDKHTRLLTHTLSIFLWLSVFTTILFGHLWVFWDGLPVVVAIGVNLAIALIYADWQRWRWKRGEKI